MRCSAKPKNSRRAFAPHPVMSPQRYACDARRGSKQSKKECSREVTCFFACLRAAASAALARAILQNANLIPA